MNIDEIKQTVGEPNNSSFLDEFPLLEHIEPISEDIYEYIEPGIAKYLKENGTKSNGFLYWFQKEL